MTKLYLLFFGLLLTINQQILSALYQPVCQPTTEIDQDTYSYYLAKVTHYFAKKDAPFFGDTDLKKNTILNAKKTMKDLNYSIQTLHGKRLQSAVKMIQNIMETLSHQIKKMLENYYEKKHSLNVYKNNQSFMTRLKSKFKSATIQEQLEQAEKITLKKNIKRAQEEYTIARKFLKEIQMIGAKYKNYLAQHTNYNKGYSKLNEPVRQDYKFYKAHGFWPNKGPNNTTPIQNIPLQQNSPEENPVQTIFNNTTGNKIIVM